MKCNFCGATYDNTVKFCPQCGTPPTGGNSAPGSGDLADAKNNLVMGILSYLGFLVFVPIFAAKDSMFARFHANQGLLLFILQTAYWVATGVISKIFYLIHWRIGSAVSGIFGLIGYVFFIFAILGIINVVKGEKKPLPFIGDIKILS